MPQSSGAQDLPPIPQDVAAYAAAHKIDRNLKPVLEMTRQVFSSGAIKLRLPSVQDPEDPHIVVEVNVAGYPDDRVFSAQTEWTEELLNRSTSQVCTFRLSLI